MSTITPAGWARYKKIMRSAHNMFNQDVLTWVRYVDTIVKFNEETTDNGEVIVLNVLCSYNYFRTWPLSKHDSQGELDNQNMAVMINREYLSELSYLTPQGYLKFDPGKDYFIHRGIKYKCEGDTFTSQAYNDPLHILLVMRREEVLNGETLHEQSEVKTVIMEANRPLLIIKALEPTF
jgi:hypothetical protein